MASWLAAGSGCSTTRNVANAQRSTKPELRKEQLWRAEQLVACRATSSAQLRLPVQWVCQKPCADRSQLSAAGRSEAVSSPQIVVLELKRVPRVLAHKRSADAACYRFRLRRANSGPRCTIFIVIPAERTGLCPASESRNPVTGRFVHPLNPRLLSRGSRSPGAAGLA